MIENNKEILLAETMLESELFQYLATYCTSLGDDEERNKNVLACLLAPILAHVDKKNVMFSDMSVMSDFLVFIAAVHNLSTPGYFDEYMKVIPMDEKVLKLFKKSEKKYKDELAKLEAELEDVDDSYKMPGAQL